MTAGYIAVTAVCCAVGLCLIALFIWFSNSKFTVTRYSLKSEKLAYVRGKRGGEVKIIHLSDLHAKQFGKNNRRLICAVENENPDFIVFTGDIIHKYRERDIAVAVRLVEELSSRFPFLYVSGNHEMRNKRYSSLRKRLKEAGAVVLDDWSVDMCGLTVVGLNCAHLKNDTVFRIMPDSGGFRLLLAHDPRYLVRYARAGCDLVLSGHAHGGQWRIPFTDVGIFAPGQGLFPKLASGEHTCGSTKMIISRGLGNSECPLRLFNRPEIVAVTLSAERLPIN